MIKTVHGIFKWIAYIWTGFWVLFGVLGLVASIVGIATEPNAPGSALLIGPVVGGLVWVVGMLPLLPVLYFTRPSAWPDKAPAPPQATTTEARP